MEQWLKWYVRKQINMSSNKLFTDIIKISIGTADIAVFNPSPEEWETLNNEARRQSLLGICFAGVRRVPQ